MTRRATEEVVEPREGLEVGPLRVLDGDDERRLLRDAHGHVGERHPQRVTRGAGVDALGQRLVGDEARDEVARARADDVDLREQHVGGGHRVFEAGALGDAGDPARDVGHDAERMALGERLGAHERDAR